MTKIFRKTPPEELILRYFDCFGVKGFFDESEFDASCITSEVIQKLDLLLIELEPYYTKHKKFMITRPMEARHYIQVLRNLCQIHKFVFYTKFTDSKTSYRILNTDNPDTAFYHIMMKKVESHTIAKIPFTISFS